MELDQATQTYISKFRVKDLHTVLKRLGLPNQGLKSALVQRLVNYIKLAGGRAATPEEADKAREAAREVVREVYVQAFPPASAAIHLPAAADQRAVMSDTEQHRNATLRQTPGLDDLYPQEPPGFVPGRRKATNFVHAQQLRTNIQNGHSSQHLTVRGGKHNPNVKCPCRTQVYADAKELLVCHTCKMLNRNTLQHGTHMGYDMTKISAAQRASHMCEQCRLDYADPFWKQFPEVKPGADPRDGWILPLTWLRHQGPAMHSQNVPNNVSLLYSADAPFSGTMIDGRRRNKEIQIQAVCLDVSDSTVCQNRIHWPDRMEVAVRGQQARVMSRNHKLGTNGRDSPTDLTPWLKGDAASLQVAMKAVGTDSSFLFGVRAVVPRPLEAVIGMLAPAESPDEAVKRIAHAVGGGADDDDDDIIMGDTLPVSLRDPLSNLRVQRGLRVVGGKSMQPFDMDFFLDSAKRSRKWQCPVSMKNVLIHQLQPDLYMNAVLHALRNRPHVTDILVNKDGWWCCEGENEWQDIREGPQESFMLPPMREDVVPDGGASSSSCPSRGQKRPREEAPKILVATLNAQHGLSGQSGRTGIAAGGQGTNTGAGGAQAAPPPGAADVITISDSDDDDTAVPAAPSAPPPAASNHAVQTTAAPHAPSTQHLGAGVMLQAFSAPTVPPVHLQQHSVTATSVTSSSHHFQHPVPLAPQMTMLPNVMQPAGPMSGIPLFSPPGYGYPQQQVQHPHGREGQPPPPPPCDNRQRW